MKSKQEIIFDIRHNLWADSVTKTFGEVKHPVCARRERDDYEPSSPDEVAALSFYNRACSNERMWRNACVSAALTDVSRQPTKRVVVAKLLDAADFERRTTGGHDRTLAVAGELGLLSDLSEALSREQIDAIVSDALTEEVE